MIEERRNNIHAQRLTFTNTIYFILLATTAVLPLPAAVSLEMPPLSSSKHHTSDFGARKNHPTTYEESAAFKGPLVLSRSASTSTSENRIRIQNFYLDESNEFILPKAPLPPLKNTASTDVILERIVNHFAYNDAPLDVKEVAESVEFYLRTRKRMLGAAKKHHKKSLRLRAKRAAEEEGKFSSTQLDDIPNDINVFDLCSGHGFTGMLFAACNPPRNNPNEQIVKVILLDIQKPPSHQILLDLITEVCPWVENAIQFVTMPIEEFKGDDDNSDIPNTSIVIATHACGKLTDKALAFSVKIKACGIAAMPCCYTGTDKGAPFGVKRAMGVSWAADIRRSFFLNEHNYHTDFSTIPMEITPMNRIIVAEDRS